MRVLHVFEDDSTHTFLSAKHAQFFRLCFGDMVFNLSPIMTYPSSSHQQTLDCQIKPIKLEAQGWINTLKTMENWTDYQFPGSRIYISDELGQDFINISDSPITLLTQLKFTVNQNLPFHSQYICYYSIFPLWSGPAYLSHNTLPHFLDSSQTKPFLIPYKPRCFILTMS